MQTTFSSANERSPISINFIAPQGWHKLSGKQLRYIYQLLADEFATGEIKTLLCAQISGVIRPERKQKILASRRGFSCASGWA